MPAARTASLGLLMMVALSDRANAQSRSVDGHVRDTADRPIVGAIVTIGGTRRAAQTNGSGAFRITVDSGGGWLTARRLGFRPDSVRLAAEPGTIVVVLHEDAVVLRAVHVVDDAVPSDTRIVPRATVRNTPSFLENDIIRTLTFMPAVSQPNDLKGRLHLAGGASDETGYALDGHPLQEPFHLAGIMGSMTSAAVDRADVTIHHLPVDRDGRMGGLINFETARPGASGNRELSLGMASSSVTVAHEWRNRRVSALGSVRSTFIDELLDVFGGSIGDASGGDVPLLRYRDAIGVLRVGSPEASEVVLTGFMSGDAMTGNDSLQGRKPILGWGETLIGLRGRRPLGARMDVNARVSWGRVHQRDTAQVTGRINRMRHDLVSSAVTARLPIGRQTSALLGAALDVRRVDDTWDARGGEDEDVFLSPRLPLAGRATDRQRVVALFSQLDTRWRRVDVNAGARLNWYDGVPTLSPRLSLRQTLSPRWMLRASYSRRTQGDTQLEEPREFNALQPVFFLDQPRTVDVLASSIVRRPIGRSTTRWEASAFVKRYPNAPLLLGNPRIEQLTTDTPAESFATFQRVPARAYGASIDMIWPVSSRWFVQGAYTCQRSDVERGDWSPADWDVPHHLNVFSSVRLGRRWILSGALIAHSGLPTTPAIARSWESLSSFAPPLDERYVLGPRNSARVAGYFRSDLGIRRVWGRGRRESSLAINVLNASARTNPVTYDFRSWSCYRSGACQTPPADRRGMPILPSISYSTRW